MSDFKAMRDSAARELLQYVCEHRELPKNAYYDWDTAEIVKECADIGYLENVRTVRTLDGRVHPQAVRPFVTQKGLEFLSAWEAPDTSLCSNNPHLDRIAEELAHMNDDVRQNHAEEQSEKKKDRRFQLFNTLVGALLGAVFTLLIEHWSAIINLLSELFR